MNMRAVFEVLLWELPKIYIKLTEDTVYDKALLLRYPLQKKAILEKNSKLILDKISTNLGSILNANQ